MSITGRGLGGALSTREDRLFLVWVLGVVREGFMEEGTLGAGPDVRALNCVWKQWGATDNGQLEA